MNDGDDGPAPDDREGTAGERREARSKPRACPACGSPRVATVLYGMPDLSAKLAEDLAKGRTVPGGCCITGDDPAWQCADCGQRIHRSHSLKSQ